MKDREGLREKPKERERINLRCMQACLERYDDTIYGIPFLDNIILVQFMCDQDITSPKIDPNLLYLVFMCFCQLLFQWHLSL